MDGDTIDQALSEIESGAILSGPEDAVWDNIFDWIQNAIATITRAITDWLDWLWGKILDKFYWLWDIISSTFWGWFNWLWDRIKPWFTWLGDKFSWLWNTISSWFSTTMANLRSSISSWFSQVFSWFDWLWDRISSSLGTWLSNITSTISTSFTVLGGRLESSFAWLADTVSSKVDLLLADIRELLPEWIAKPGEWVGVLLDGVAAWLVEDIPGHSPRWWDIFAAVGDFLKTWFFDFPKWFLEDVPERVAYGLAESFKWVSDTIEPVMESFTNTILAFARSIGPMSPDQAVSNFSSISKIGFAAIAGLTGMTVAGELLHPLKRIGLGNIAAVVWDMTNYKMITGAFIGALTYSMLRQPLNYYFNSIFRPMVLPEKVFTELLSRRAFTQPELLQNPELTRSVALLPYGGGSAYESDLIGYYGYPAAYHGLYSELANTRLGYFALAGIARTGFWDETWFIEALARTGYSKTARDALMLMYKEQVKYARQQPVMYHLRRLAREGFYTVAKVKEVLEEAVAAPTLDDVRVMAMELEQEYETYDMALDISLRCFSRGVISESECRNNLSRLNIPGTLVDVHLAREKLGLIRRIPWAPPEQMPTLQYVED